MDSYQTGDFGEGRGGQHLMNAARAQTLRYSNFLLTISTNKVPKDDAERDELVDWLIRTLEPLFSNFDVLNGNLLKPAGTRNYEKAQFPEDNLIIKVRSVTSIEQGAAQHGQIHAHVLLEVAHKYITQMHGATGEGGDTGKGNLGVHVNIGALRDYMNGHIPSMHIDNPPPKIYCDCKLLTKGTDNSNKWLTLQYITKDSAKDNGGGVRNLRADENAAADPVLSGARRALTQGGLEHDPIRITISDNNNNNNNNEPDWRNDDFGVGGAISPPMMRKTTVSAPAMKKTTVSAPSMQKTTVSAPKFVPTSGPKNGPRKF